MNCPYCNHAMSDHGVIWTNVTGVSICAGNHSSDVCQCELTEAQASRAAQRQAAAAGLHGMIDNRENRDLRAGYVAALRDVGILAPGESAATLLAEWPAQ